MLDKWVSDQIGSPVLNRDVLDMWQLDQLNETLKWASEHSRFYAERLSGGSFRSFREFAGLPFTTPEDLRTDGNRMLCVPAGQIARIVSQTTSGSSGPPKRICFGMDDIESTIEYFQNGLREFVLPKDHCLVLFPGKGEFGLNDLIGKALLRLDCSCSVFGFPDETRYEELLDVIEKEKASFLIGTAASMAGAARYSRITKREDQIAGSIHGVLAASEYVDEKDRQDLIDIWNCEVNEHYSMTETGYAGAVGCSVPGGYHIWESGVYYEIIDPETGCVLPTGEVGEIVVTTLGHRVMPFIRYRTGDISRIVRNQCSCGSCLKRLERVRDRRIVKKFRTDQMISAP